MCLVLEKFSCVFIDFYLGLKEMAGKVQSLDRILTLVVDGKPIRLKRGFLPASPRAC